VGQLQARISHVKIEEEASQVKNAQAAEEIQRIAKERDEARNEAEKERAKYIVCSFSL
jgi:hypothetical protein